MKTHTLNILFWNKDDDNTKQITIHTAYPSYEDVEEYLESNGLDDFKIDGGNFDYFEINFV
jgi:hypothetical protein